MLTNIIKRYPISIATAVFITTISLIPIPEFPPAQDIPLVDKWVHFIMYGCLCCIIWYEYWKHHTKWNILRTCIWAIFAPICMSGLLEIMQSTLTTTRNGEWLDLAANSIGVGIGALLGTTLIRLAERRIHRAKGNKG